MQHSASLAFALCTSRNVPEARLMCERARMHGYNALWYIIHNPGTWRRNEVSRTLEVMGWLIAECGEDVNERDLLGDALWLQRLQLTSFLLDHGARPLGNVFTRLAHFRRMRDEKRIIWKLLEHGASVAVDHHVSKHVRGLHSRRVAARSAAVAAYHAIRATCGRDVAELVARRVWHTRNNFKWQQQQQQEPVAPITTSRYGANMHVFVYIVCYYVMIFIISVARLL